MSLKTTKRENIIILKSWPDSDEISLTILANQTKSSIAR